MIKEKIEIVKGDITKIEVDAIVNAANSSLLGGGGVDGAIHRAAGKELLHECRLLHGCKTGEAKITKGYNLPAKFVIHTVGPVWNGGTHNESVLLEKCFSNSLTLAVKNNCRSVAFPAISTGIYRYPFEQATEIAIKTTVEFLKQNNFPEKVIFICFSEEMFNIYKKTLDELL
ncbi:Appr-1-p processing protein [Sporocytophaga myxococcoides]|uniref:Appr-1-p processing protein n=1 Tax=Sporocytophaga myxococcoides TaxID=153721 RepID=A0A098LI72_9BACT|nr:O-acetyl-ADP-ribose deacetylase [Sporocytophaga myxococcoides]GAL86174.1 Appr-1-p processing protein [Sporocytophaga myxococcoides]